MLVWHVCRSGWCWPILHLFVSCVRRWGVAPGAVLHGVGGWVAWLVLAVRSWWCSSVLVGCCCCSSMFVGVDAAVVFCLLFVVFVVGLLGWCWLSVCGVCRCCWGAAVVHPCSWHWRCCCPASTRRLRGTGGVAWLVLVVGSRWHSTAGCCCCSSVFIGIDAAAILLLLVVFVELVVNGFSNYHV